MTTDQIQLHGLRVKFRPAEQGDTGVILASWVRQVRKMQPFREMDREEFGRHVDLIHRLIARSEVIVACEPDHPIQVFGWICAELQAFPVLHFVYVRRDWRRLGIGESLIRRAFVIDLGAEPLFYTHKTKAAPFYRDRWALKYNPYLVEAP